MARLKPANAKFGLAPLRDPPVFAQACFIQGEDWTVEWPEQDIQIGADTLWHGGGSLGQGCGITFTPHRKIIIFE